MSSWDPCHIGRAIIRLGAPPTSRIKPLEGSSTPNDADCRTKHRVHGCKPGPTDFGGGHGRCLAFLLLSPRFKSSCPACFGLSGFATARIAHFNVPCHLHQAGGTLTSFPCDRAIIFTPHARTSGSPISEEGSWCHGQVHKNSAILVLCPLVQSD